MKQLCRQMHTEINQWPSLVKIVQGAMNRKRRASRGNRSPIELTTGIAPRTTASLLHKGGGEVQVLDEDATRTVDEAAAALAERMEEIYDAANVARRAKSAQNRRRTSMCAIPDIAVGDFVLYARNEGHDKLTYTWLGPAVVLRAVTPLVYTIRPYTMYETEPKDVHITRLRRFAGSRLNMTEQLRIDVEYDHPDNIVHRLVAHKMDNGELWFKCRWKGFTAAMDSWQTATVPW